MEWLMYMLLRSIIVVSGIYSTYWLIVEMPVLVKIKHEELYERWRDR